MCSKGTRNQKLCIRNGIHSLVLMYTMIQTVSCYILLSMGCCFSHIKIYGDLNEVDYLRSTTSFLAFEDTLDKKRALIIGVGGGQEVLAAQLAGFKEIEAVDINPGSFRAVQTVASFSGDVFNQPGVKAVVSDGRNYIRQTQNRYDLIYLSLVKKNRRTV